MKTPEASFLTWQRKFYTEDDCIRHLKTLKWPNGFICPRCMHNKGFELSNRKVTECSKYHKQTSVLAGTLFHRTHLPLLKWFWSLYFIGSDKGSILALRLSKLIEVNWRTARLILRKVREAMGHRDSLYRLSGTMMLLLVVSKKEKEVVVQVEKLPFLLLVITEKRKLVLLQ